jgi:NTP pyrophosphatase (non-canonical NTP hydrolase)
VEEAGEAAAAWIGAIGRNPRKGTTHSRRDVAEELGDVAFTALVAAASLRHDPRERLNSPQPPADGSTREPGEHVV